MKISPESKAVREGSIEGCGLQGIGRERREREAGR